MRTVLVVDDEPAMRHMLRLILEREKFNVIEASDGVSGLRQLASGSVDVVLCDIRMPDLDGLGFLATAARMETAVTIIMMSAYGSIDIAIECIKQGAYDYISKPFKSDEVVLTLRKAEERLRLQRENQSLRFRLAHSRAFMKDQFAGWKSPAMRSLLSQVGRTANSRTNVLITGETGVGKELIAHALHTVGVAGESPFVAVNCGAISPHLLESEFFGHVRGAFTGADRDHPGMLAAAHGGTLFLDEIGDLSPDLQPKLLRVLQEGEYRPVGSAHLRKVNVRVLSATNRNLREAVDSGAFRSDLYYRLAVVELHVPALRERREDIPLLLLHFLGSIAVRQGRVTPRLSSSAMRAVQQHDWPGNVRELENFAERIMVFCRQEEIDAADLPWGETSSGETSGSLSLKDAYHRIEIDYIRRALLQTGGNRTQAAKMLELSLRNLQYKLKDLGIDA